ncbi:MAG: hypothetical protein UY83_C0002G0018 [Candidatus Adlerbacteria bacterium GW2011_GWA1_54_10]|uniref:Uncharacterized protein n=2 Tax=Candidatus Adleribacteriota TaxID=1752736 RepID=A0A0G1XXY1_9BACT|nr:MAG: hypothetical protein UY83_C0002G0018 [Candidatus Adlerbacteria bacterium GW2011_GWA1_54_10]KKW37997.1 MAG: hypothetical protein UY86_C0002G0094 [Candidatus Adlerbacteria bacterium GW2011_GWB1_54_7]
MTSARWSTPVSFRIRASSDSGGTHHPSTTKLKETGNEEDFPGYVRRDDDDWLGFSQPAQCVWHQHQHQLQYRFAIQRTNDIAVESAVELPDTEPVARPVAVPHQVVQLQLRVGRLLLGLSRLLKRDDSVLRSTRFPVALARPGPFLFSVSYVKIQSHPRPALYIPFLPSV